MKSTGRARTRTAGSPNSIVNCLDSVELRDDILDENALTN